MSKNYPEVFNKFWDKLELKGKNSKTKNGCKFNYEVRSNGIYLGYDNEDKSVWHYIGNTKESLYCDMLDSYLVPRVSEY